MLAFWRSDKQGLPCNHKKVKRDVVAAPGVVTEIQGPLKLCTERALHATHHPAQHSGERLWVVALYPPYEFQSDKLGSLKREIICEIPNFFA